MTGRGIDQILSHPCNSQIYESYVKDARDYIKLAEHAHGKIPRAVAGDYLWNDALREWQKRQPDVKIMNLETAITESNHHWAGKGINYRMHPKNIDVLRSAQVDVCALANNHILDWHVEGLKETLSTLKAARIKFAGAGENQKQAMTPAIFELSDKRRILIFSMSTKSSGIPPSWGATAGRPGVYLLEDLGRKTVKQIKNNIELYQQTGDLIIVSIHWGGNWGYEIPASHQDFAHNLIDETDISLIHGHSSHHPIAIEVYNHKLILYACGDFINDYEGISGSEVFKSDLSIMYFLEFDPQLFRVSKMELVPLQIRKFQLHYARREDAEWLVDTLNRESSVYQTHFNLNHDRTISVEIRAVDGVKTYAI